MVAGNVVGLGKKTLVGTAIAKIAKRIQVSTIILCPKTDSNIGRTTLANGMGCAGKILVASSKTTRSSCTVSLGTGN